MVSGIDKFFSRAIDQSLAGRQAFWHRDFSSLEAYTASVETNRERLRTIIGAVDKRLPVPALEFVSSTSGPDGIADAGSYSVHLVRWPVFEGVFGEGLLLEPKAPPGICVVAVPDADQTPEVLCGLAPGLPPERQFARRLAENGCRVIVPVLVDREDTLSSKPEIERFTNKPHREWIYGQAYPLGRHIIGYEVQKVLAAVDFFSTRWKMAEGKALRIGVAGYGEGGLLAFYAAALDKRIDATLVSGYFDSRQRLWEEPIYRNVFALLREFGDAEIASLIAPRALIIEYSDAPRVEGPPKPRGGNAQAAPGKITTPDYNSVEQEFERARALLKRGGSNLCDKLTLITGTEGKTTGPGSDRALLTLLKALRMPGKQLAPARKLPTDLKPGADPAERQQRQVKELEDYTQKLVRDSGGVRERAFWDKLHADSPDQWRTACAPFRRALWEDIIGRLPSPTLPPSPRSRRWAPSPAELGNAKPDAWTGYEVTLDVYPDVFAWGILLLPKDLKPNERRPVVVCQHGLEGVPQDVITRDPMSSGFKYYSAFAARLAEQGFIVYAPHNPYRGQTSFRQVQRKANPLQLSLYSVILAQHSRLLEWLATLPFVDAKRIGFYGLSYGGATAMRVPALLDGYALSICSGSFNDWTRKVCATDYRGSYMFVDEYEVFEFNLGETFSNAEMAALIAPRPFMVERGHSDPVGLDEWVSGEYAKVRRLYDRLGIGDRTELEFFDGGHTINGLGTFEFLRKHLGWKDSAQQ